MAAPDLHRTLTTPFSQRAEFSDTPPLTRYLLSLISIKRSNLCVSADVHTTLDLFQVAEEVGDHICILKTHADIIDDWSKDTISGLQAIAKRKHFLLFEDRKFADIGNTLRSQYTRGPLQIATWAHLTNAHLLPGAAIVPALHSAAQQHLLSLNQSVNTTISAGPPHPTSDNENDSTKPTTTSNEPTTDTQPPQASSGSTANPSPSSSTDKNPILVSHNRNPSGSVSATTTITQHTTTLAPDHPPPTLLKSLSESESESPSHPHNTAELLTSLGPPPHARGLLLLAEMSSSGNLITPEYTTACVQTAQQNRGFVLGFISQHSLNHDQKDNFLSLAPGVTLPPLSSKDGKAVTGDGKGQVWRDPEVVVGGKEGVDIVIVGRGILGAEDQKAEAERYRRAAWAAYEGRIGRR